MSELSQRRGRRLLELAGAVAITVALWLAAHRQYERLLVLALQPAVNEATAVERDGTLFVRRPGAAEERAIVPLALVSFQFVFLAALVPLVRPRPQRNIARRSVTAVLVLILMHLLALRIGLSSVLASAFGEWSEQNYSDFAANLLLYSWQGYVVVGGYAAVFATVWLIFGSTARRTKRPQ